MQPARLFAGGISDPLTHAIDASLELTRATLYCGDHRGGQIEMTVTIGVGTEIPKKSTGRRMQHVRLRRGDVAALLRKPQLDLDPFNLGKRCPKGLGCGALTTPQLASYF